MSDDDATTRRAVDPFGFPPGLTFLWLVVFIVATIVVLNRAGHAELSFDATLLRLVDLGIGSLGVYAVVGIGYRARSAYAGGALERVSPGHGCVPLAAPQP